MDIKINWAQYEGWRGMLEVLQENTGPMPENVLWVEGNDVFFQDDPFLLPLKRGHILFSSSPYTTMTTDFWVSDSWYLGSQYSVAFTTTGLNESTKQLLGHVCDAAAAAGGEGRCERYVLSGDDFGLLIDSFRSCCRRELLAKCKDEHCTNLPSINSGVLLGEVSTVLALLDLLVSHAYDKLIKPRCCWHGAACLLSPHAGLFSSLREMTSFARETCNFPLGQTVLNYLLHTHPKEFPLEKIHFPFTTPLCSIGTFFMARDPLGGVLVDVPPARRCAVVHMFNRYTHWPTSTHPVKENMLDYFGRVYEYVPRDQRLLFPYDGIERYGIAQWVVDRSCDAVSGQAMCALPAYTQRCVNGTTTQSPGALQCLVLGD